MRCGRSSAKASMMTRRVVAWTRGLATSSSQRASWAFRSSRLRKVPRQEEVLADIAVRPLHLALRLRPIGPAGARLVAMMGGEVDQVAIVDDMPRLRLAGDDRLHARRRFEVTVAFSQKAFVLSAFAQPWVRRPLIWALNDMLIEEHFSPAMRSLVIRLANSCARSVISNSQATAKAFMALGGRKERVSVIYPGIDLERFSEANPAQERTARSLGLRIGCFGRLSPWKGQHILLQALADISGGEAWIVGAPLFGEESYEQELRALTTQLGLDNRVRFFGHRNDVPELLAACDIVAHTSTAPEPFGKAIIEGMASGRPVIATAAGGAVEIIRDGIDGLLVPFE